MKTKTEKPPLEKWPLWRLLVMLDDAERTNSPATSMLARLVADKLRQQRPTDEREEGRHDHHP